MIFEKFARKSNPHSYFIGQGCDLELYIDDENELKVPED